MIKITKEHIKAGRDSQIYEDSDIDDDFKWPDEKFLWLRFAVTGVVILAIAFLIVSGLWTVGVMLINKILEQ